MKHWENKAIALLDASLHPNATQQLKVFWSRYFERNNADLIEFGEPMISGTVK